MTEENNKDKKKCSGKGKAMFFYGIVNLGSGVISSLALVAIAFSLCSLNKESQVFNQCVQEVKESGKSASSAVRFCNGGK